MARMGYKTALKIIKGNRGARVYFPERAVEIIKSNRGGRTYLPQKLIDKKFWYVVRTYRHLARRNPDFAKLTFSVARLQKLYRSKAGRKAFNELDDFYIGKKPLKISKGTKEVNRLHKKMMKQLGLRHDDYRRKK